MSRIAAAIDGFEACLEASPESLAKQDLEILRALLEATGSLVFGLFVNPVSRALLGMTKLQTAIYANPQENLEGWRSLLVWLSNPSADSLDLILDYLVQGDARAVSMLAGS